MSSFTWLAYSEHERRRVLEVIDLFREEETRDELGMGTIRDAFADMLFPGTSTIQTRARYFLFIPWLLREMEDRRVSSRQAAKYSRRSQGRLCEALNANGDEEGVIGRLAGRHVQRLPSSVYWSGLGRWGIRLFPGSEDAYYHSLDSYYVQVEPADPADAGEAAAVSNWHPNLPDPPGDFPDRATMALAPEEAEYLRDQIRMRAPDSLLTFLIDSEVPIGEDVAFAWEHPVADDLPSAPAEQLEHARNFSQVMHGPALLYNLILAEQTERQQEVDRYHGQLRQWWEQLVGRWDEIQAWDRARLWQMFSDSGARVRRPARSFVERWFDLIWPIADLSSLIASQSARQMIVVRERQLKRGRARISNPKINKTWSGASGNAQLDYRWKRPVRAIVNDILDGLREEDDDA